MTSLRAFNLLVVDDDPLIHQSLKLAIPAPWKIFSVSKLDLIPYDHFFHAAMVDMHLTPHSDQPEGVGVIEKLLANNPHLEVIAMSGDLNRQLMEKCLKAGAQRFLAKPLMSDEVLLILNKIEAYLNLRNIDSSQSAKSSSWIGSGPRSQNIRKRIADLRGENSPILIEGETGTGKEVVARLLNQQENERPFIAVNISSITENLFESEIFGHIKGSFTGADQNKIGLAEAANGGDLFLDEIEALPFSQQVKLLRFLESGEIRRVGAKDTLKIQTRIIAASNQPLKKLVSDGKFREDLYFRLHGQHIELPPLRERTEDIPELAKNFLNSERPRRNKEFAEDGIAALQAYHWPGNVRELKRVCEQLSLTSPLPFIRKEDVLALLSPSTNSSAPSDRIEGADLNRGLNDLVADYEAKIIRLSMRTTPDIEELAKLLKISRSSLYKKIKDYNIDSESV